MSTKEDKIKRKFDKLSKSVEPKPDLLKHCISAFIVGGLICDVGQFLYNMLLAYSVSKEDASNIVPIIMVFLGALFTGLGLYDKLASFAGAGTVVPITGFANAVVSPAIEYKKEGFVFGVAAKMFNIAGPVLVYGIGSSVIIGIIYWIMNIFKG